MPLYCHVAEPYSTIQYCYSRNVFGKLKMPCNYISAMHKYIDAEVGLENYTFSVLMSHLLMPKVSHLPSTPLAVLVCISAVPSVPAISAPLSVGYVPPTKGKAIHKQQTTKKTLP